MSSTAITEFLFLIARVGMPMAPAVTAPHTQAPLAGAARALIGMGIARPTATADSYTIKI
jgi:hypothetical protein